MISIITRQGGDELDLPKDTKISVETSSPFLSEDGSFVLPLTLPPSIRNLRLLNMPHRVDQADFKAAKLEVIVRAGSFQKSGLLVTINSNLSSGIQCTILFDDSGIYNAIKNKTLSTIFYNEKRDDYAAEPDIEMQRLNWVAQLEHVMRGDYPDDIFSVFPVKTTQGIILNQQDVTTFLTDPRGNEYYRLLMRFPHQFTIDDKQIVFPEGFFITPFLKLWYVIKQVCAYAGYELESNPFFDLPNFKKIVVLNNTADSIMANGTVYLRNLVPDMDASDFLKSLFPLFGAAFISTSSNKLKVVFFDQLLKQPATKDLTPFLSSSPTFNYVESKSLSIACEHLTADSDIAITNWDDFIDKYPNIQYVSENEIAALAVNSVFFHKQKLFFAIRTTAGYDRIKYDQFDIKDNSLTSSELPAKHQDYYMGDNTADNESSVAVFPVIGEFRNMVMNVIQDSVNISSDAECKLMLAFEHGRMIGSTELQRRVYGSSHTYLNNGSLDEEDGFNLMYAGDLGLFNTFFKNYDAALRKGMIPIAAPLSLPKDEIIQLNYDQVVLINARKCIPIKLRYEITDENIELIESQFYTI